MLYIPSTSQAVPFSRPLSFLAMNVAKQHFDSIPTGIHVFIPSFRKLWSQGLLWSESSWMMRCGSNKLTLEASWIS